MEESKPSIHRDPGEEFFVTSSFIRDCRRGGYGFRGQVDRVYIVHGVLPSAPWTSADSNLQCTYGVHIV